MRTVIAKLLPVLFALCAALLHGAVAPVSAESSTPVRREHYVAARPQVTLRAGPGPNHRRTGELHYGTPVSVLERTRRGNWLRVQDSSGVIGWVPGRTVRVRRVKVVAETAAQAQPATALEAPQQPEVIAPPAAAPQPTVVDAQPARPALQFGVRAADIFARGKQLGNNPNAFAIVGDSLSTVQPFMRGFGEGGFSLGPHAYLLETVRYFSVPSAAQDYFGRKSKAATLAFNAAAALDSSWTVWTDKAGECQSGEIPLLCEYRLIKPSVAVILLGPEDVQIYDAATFQTHLARIVKASADSGVIPVLTTFPTDSANPALASAEAFNTAIRNVAASNGVPLIELRDSAMRLPNAGVQPDGFHLSDNGPAYHFEGNPGSYSGCALRNLLTLQMLDALRRNVLTR